jgi:uncharacterized cupin superfamily protein
MPKIIPPPLTLETSYNHPVIGGGLGDYLHAVIGEAGGLTQFGVHLEVLPPGSRSSFRHWHEAEDEMIYLLSGELILIEDSETILRPGEAACWPAGHPVGHCFENRSGSDATYLTIGARKPADVIHYPEHDLITVRQGSARRYLFADGKAREDG